MLSLPAPHSPTTGPLQKRLAIAKIAFILFNLPMSRKKNKRADLQTPAIQVEFNTVKKHSPLHPPL